MSNVLPVIGLSGVGKSTVLEEAMLSTGAFLIGASLKRIPNRSGEAEKAAEQLATSLHRYSESSYLSVRNGKSGQIHASNRWILSTVL